MVRASNTRWHGLHGCGDYRAERELKADVDFFFSSRRRHTRFDCDWSSDVCSSDLAMAGAQIRRFLILHKELDADDGEVTRTQKVRRGFVAERYAPLITALYSGAPRSEERRVGKECRSRWSPYH